MKYTPGRNLLNNTPRSEVGTISVTENGTRVYGTTSSDSISVLTIGRVKSVSMSQLAGETLYGNVKVTNNGSKTIELLINGVGGVSAKISAGETKDVAISGTYTSANAFPMLIFKAENYNEAFDITVSDWRLAFGEAVPSEKLAPENTTTMGDSIAADSITI